VSYIVPVNVNTGEVDVVRYVTGEPSYCVPVPPSSLPEIPFPFPDADVWWSTCVLLIYIVHLDVDVRTSILMTISVRSLDDQYGGMDQDVWISPPTLLLIPPCAYRIPLKMYRDNPTAPPPDSYMIPSDDESMVTLVIRTPEVAL
jgi:hypothetical protein